MIYSYKVNSLPNVVPIGYVGEKNHRQIDIDITDWLKEMPDGVPSIVHMRPGETEEQAYVAATTYADGVIHWVITAGDLGAVEGTGSAQVMLEKEENDAVVRRGKSALFATLIKDSIGEPTRTVPAGVQTVLDQMTVLRNAAVAAYEGIMEADMNYPIISDETGNWMLWDPLTDQWVDSGYTASGNPGPQGEKGDPGDTGPAGPEGPEGPQGAKGDTGEKGDPGDEGPKGETGPAGAKGDKGDTGAKGDKGDPGADGTDGVSPTVEVETISGGHTVTITDAEGDHSFSVMDGADGQDGAPGQDGADGQDGVSPTVSTATITGGHSVTITDAQGDHTFNVMDGEDGATGQTGPAGPGVASGGTAGQVLKKASGTDYDTEWDDPFEGSTFDYDDIHTFTAGHEGIVNWLKAKVEPVQSGTGDPSPSNVRPISGFASANVFTAGKNLIPMVLDNIKQSNTSIGSWSDNVWTYAGITITVNTDSNGGVTDFTVNGANTSGGAFSFILFGSDQFSASRFNGYYLSGGLQGCRVRISDVDKGSTATDDNPSVQINRQNTGKIAIQLRISASANLSNVSVKPMISANANDTYEQYAGGLYPVSFPTSAGTVYGGELTVNADGTGKLVVDRAKIKLENLTTTEIQIFTTFTNYVRVEYYPLRTLGKPLKSHICDSFKTMDGLPDGPYQIARSESDSAVRCLFTLPTTVTDVNQAISTLNTIKPEMVYYLATPITYDLSAPQIATLLVNNIWCDTGDCSLQYSESVDQGDTTTAVTTGEKANWNNALNRLTDILDMLAFREAGFTATETHQQDTVIVVGTELYRTTAAIPAGNAIIPGTNCTKTTIIDEIVRLTT